MLHSNRLIHCLVGLLASVSCNEGGETNGQPRKSLCGMSRGYAAEIAPRDKEGRSLENGLWITVENALPVHREDGNIISQTFIEAEIEACDMTEWASAEDGAMQDIDENEEGATLSRRRREEQRSPLTAPVRFAFGAKILSESKKTFWLSPQQVDMLVEKSGGPVRLNIMDSVQVARHPYHCNLGSLTRDEQQSRIRPSAEAPVQELTFKVTSRHSLSFQCEVN